MYVFGITGGVGAGKSTVLGLLSENFNANIIKADDVGHMVMEPGEKAYEQIVDIFGEEVLETTDKDSPINRKKLGEIIFNNKNKRMVLNSIIHPQVKKFIMEEIARVRCAGKYDFCFVEAALLIEDHYEVMCDELWYIYADEKTRRKRLRQSRGYSDEKIDGIFASQLSEDEFKAKCDRIIDNSADEAHTLQQLKEIMSGYGKVG